MGVTAEVSPITHRILKRLDPTMLPIAISVSFFMAADIDAASSGRLVPKATMVIPIILWLTPKDEAIFEAPSIRRFAPKARPILDKMIKSTASHKLSVFSSLSSARSEERRVGKEC